jgi:tetratricopeptide (TPR) repeat protein
MLRTLGELRMEGSAFARPKPLLLLAYLTLEGVRPRRELRTVFWPGDPDAATHLRVTLARLRQGLGEVVRTDGERVESCVEVDVTDLLRAHAQSRDEDVVTLGHAAFLDHVALPPLGAALEEWLLTTRESVGARVRDALLRLSARAVVRGDSARGGELAARAYDLRGAPEPSLTDLATVHDLLLASGHVLARTVREEAEAFDVPVAPSAEDARRAVTARLGEARPGGGQRSGLPAAPSWTVGRDEELARLGTWLTDAGVRGVVLTGPGGIGKTHLALVAAQRWLAGSPTTFVDLAGAGTADVARERILDAVSGALTPPTWLLLDNADDLDDPQDLLTSLLARPDAPRLLVTSRTTVRHRDARVLQVGGLSLTPLAPERLSDAASLLVRRLHWSREAGTPDRTALERLAHVLSGQPLALELAAAWGDALGLSGLPTALARDPTLLDSAPSDGALSSPRVVFERSWRRLPGPLRRVLARLSVFEGGCRTDAALAVAGATPAQLAALVDRSLLRLTAGARFELHPLVRTYAGEALRGEGDALTRCRARHRRFYLANSRTLDAADFDNVRAAWEAPPEDPDDVAALTAAASGVRALAVRAGRCAEGAALLLRASVPDDTVRAVRVDAAWLLLKADRVEEAHVVAESVAAGLTDAADSAGGALLERSLHVRAAIAQARADLAGARTHWQTLWTLAEARGDERACLRTRESLAIVDEGLGNVEEAERAYLDLIALGRQGRPELLARTLLNYGVLLVNLDRADEGRVVLRESERLADDALRPWVEANVAEAERKQGRSRDAARRCDALLVHEACRTSVTLRGAVLDVRARARLSCGDVRGAAHDARASVHDAWRSAGRTATLDRLALAASVLSGGGRSELATALRRWLLGVPSLAFWTRRALLQGAAGEEAGPTSSPETDLAAWVTRSDLALAGLAGPEDPSARPVQSSSGSGTT